MGTSAKVPVFQQCPACGYDLLTREGERACHYYECPYLPEELDATCPVCMYDFVVQDGNAECGDPPSCAFALDEAPIRVANVRAWAAGRVRDRGGVPGTREPGNPPVERVRRPTGTGD